MLSDKIHNLGKLFVQIYIPASSSLYYGLSAIWHFPYAEEVIGTLAVLAVFIGVVLGINNSQVNQNTGKATLPLMAKSVLGIGKTATVKYDGKMVVETSEETGKKIYSLELESDPENLDQKSSVIFEVMSKQ